MMVAPYQYRTEYAITPVDISSSYRVSLYIVAAVKAQTKRFQECLIVYLDEYYIESMWLGSNHQYERTQNIRYQVDVHSQFEQVTANLSDFSSVHIQSTSLSQLLWNMLGVLRFRSRVDEKKDFIVISFISSQSQLPQQCYPSYLQTVQVLHFG